MKLFRVRKEWSASDHDFIAVIAESRQAIADYYASLGDLGPRYIEVTEMDGIFRLEKGFMKQVDTK